VYRSAYSTLDFFRETARFKMQLRRAACSTVPGRTVSSTETDDNPIILFAKTQQRNTTQRGMVIEGGREGTHPAIGWNQRLRPDADAWPSEPS
jgi:hypothetical protein